MIICFIMAAKNELKPSFKTTAYICGAWLFTAVLTSALGTRIRQVISSFTVVQEPVLFIS